MEDLQLHDQQPGLAEGSPDKVAVIPAASNASLMITASSSMLVASEISTMADQHFARLTRPLPLPEILLYLLIRQQLELIFKKPPEIAHRWIPIIEGEEADVAHQSTHQHTLFFQALQLTLGHVQPKAERLGDAQGMSFPVALQKQQHPCRRAVTEDRFKHWVHGWIKSTPLVDCSTPILSHATPDGGGMTLVQASQAAVRAKAVQPTARQVYYPSPWGPPRRPTHGSW